MSAICGTTRRLLWPDTGPRPVSAEIVVAQEHLTACRECRQFMVDIRATADLARTIDGPPMAAAARERLFSALARKRAAMPKPLSRRYAWAGMAAASIVLVAAATTAVWYQRSRAEAPPEILSALAGDHANTLSDARVATSNRADVSRWLSHRVPFAVFVPTLTGATLSGARVVQMEGRATAVIEYKLGDEMLSYFIVPSNEDRSTAGYPPRFARQSRAGYRLVSWHDAGLMHAMVGNIASSELEKFAHACVDQMRRMGHGDERSGTKRELAAGQLPSGALAERRFRRQS